MFPEFIKFWIVVFILYYSFWVNTESAYILFQAFVPCSPVHAKALYNWSECCALSYGFKYFTKLDRLKTFLNSRNMINIINSENVIVFFNYEFKNLPRCNTTGGKKITFSSFDFSLWIVRLYYWTSKMVIFSMLIKESIEIEYGWVFFSFKS